jgi:hypothetical protein
MGEASAHDRNLYLTKHNNHNRQTSMLQAGFEPTIPASDRLQIYVLDHATTGIRRHRHEILYYFAGQERDVIKC